MFVGPMMMGLVMTPLLSALFQNRVPKRLLAVIAQCPLHVVQLQQIASQLAAAFNHAQTASESKPHSESKIMDTAEEQKAAFTSAKPVGSDKLDAAKKDSKILPPYVPWLSHSSQLTLLIAWL